MRPVVFVLEVVAITVTSLAQSSVPRTDKVGDNSISAPCSVTGRVVAAADGNPLKSARVVLIPEHSRSDHQIYATSSDVDGRFTIKDVPSGSYKFFASHSGFVDQHYKAGANDTGPLFSLHPGEKVSDVLFRLIAASVIMGRITNEDGDGMQRVQVVALRRPTQEETEDEEELPRRHKMQMQPVASAQSDDRGQYRIFGLKPGEYYIRAEDSPQPPVGSIPVEEGFWVNQSLGSEYASLYCPGVAQVSQAQVIPIKAGEEVQADVAMRRVKTVEIAGHVIGASPSTQAFVSLTPIEGSDDFDRQDTTDDKGSFRLRNVPEGSYYVIVYQRVEGSGGVYQSSARQKIEVAGDNIDSLTITLGTGVTIQGRVKVDGASSIALDRINVTLASVDEDSLPGGRAGPKKDGTFEMKSVPDGNYSLSIWGLEHDAYVKSIRFGSDDALEKGVQVESGGSSGRLEVVISSQGAQLEGSVSGDDGPVIGARVRLAPDPLTPYNHLRIQRTITDQLGHFSLAKIAPGKYTLTAKPMVSSETFPYKSEPQTLMFAENDHKTIEMKLEKQQK